VQLFKFTCGPYTISLGDDLPSLYYSYCQQAQLVETFEVEGSYSALCYLAVAHGHSWPFLIVAQRYSPGPQSGFHPGVLFVPETNLLFLGAGERLLAYTLARPARLWECGLTGGFWQWERAQESIILSSENKLATWDMHGHKQWDFVVEPPWQYALDGDTIHVALGDKQIALHCERGIVIESTAIRS
jgi:hypothetical protein